MSPEQAAVQAADRLNRCFVEFPDDPFIWYEYLQVLGEALTRCPGTWSHGSRRPVQLPCPGLGGTGPACCARAGERRDNYAPFEPWAFECPAECPCHVREGRPRAA